MSAIKMSEQDLCESVRRFKRDPYVHGCLKLICEIHTYAIPIIKVDVNDSSNVIFDIDEASKKRIEWWRERIKEYANTYFPELNFQT